MKDGLTLVKELKDKIHEQQFEIKRLKELCDKYEEEHKTTFEEWKKTINIINELEKWLDKEINQLKFEDNYESADTLEIVQETLKELKGVDKE